MPISSSRARLTGFTRQGRRASRETSPASPLIKFRVGGKIFSCKKDKLVNASSVFSVMLNGSFAQPRIFRISDVSAASFEIMISAITDINLKQIASKITGVWEAVDALHTAHMYEIRHLETYLITHITRRIDWANVLEMMEHAKALNLKRIQSKCWSVIEKFTSKVVNTPEFERIPWDLLLDILENNHLSVNEMALVRAVYRWCKYQQLVDANNKKKSIRDIIGVAVYKIRFPLMTRSEFRIVESFGMLVKGEVEDLKSNLRFNQTFPNRIRGNFCECTRKHLNCTFCTRNNKMSSIRPKSFAYKRTLTAESTVSMCECRKYMSCPNYPNGMSVDDE